MKTPITILLVLFLSASINAQNDNESKGCGTVYPPELDAWRTSNHQNPNRPVHKQGTTYYIPVKFHLVSKSDGTGGYKKSDLLNILCTTNAQFAPAGFRFYLAGSTQYITKDNDIQYIQSDFFYSYTDASVATQLYQSYNADNVYNAYVMSWIGGPCGRTMYSPRNGGAELIISCMNTNPPSIIPHEAGHWFSLPHTFTGWEGTPCYTSICNPSTLSCWPNNVENVDRTGPNANCTTAGDGYCDTEADYYNDRWCPSACNTWKDPTGVPLNADPTLYMAYANEPCQNRFSPEQINDMIAYLVNNRDYLLNLPQPETDTITSTATLVSPLNNDSIPSDYYVLRWKAVPNATMYHLLISKSTTFSSSIKVDYFTQDTFYIITTATNIEENKKHYWKVKAFNPAYTCGAYSAAGNFWGGKATGLASNSTFHDKITVYPNPVSGNQIHFFLDNDQPSPAKVMIYNINGQIIYEEDKVFQQGRNEEIITLDAPTPSGVYLFCLISENASYMQRIVVVN